MVQGYPQRMRLQRQLFLYTFNSLLCNYKLLSHFAKLLSKPFKNSIPGRTLKCNIRIVLFYKFLIIAAKYSGLTDASPPPSNDAKQHKHSLKGLPPPNTPDPQVLFFK